MSMFFKHKRTHVPSPQNDGPPFKKMEKPSPFAIIQLAKVHKTYASNAMPHVALRQIDLRISSGEFVMVVGKSGSGKSTLINMLTGIDRPTSGAVLMNGVPLHQLDENDLARWRRRNLGIVFQFFQLLPTLTVLENVLLPMDFLPDYHARIAQEQAMKLLSLVEMADHAHKLPSALSGGQQQRVAIARALANNPPILIADEPTGNLDSKTADRIYRLFEMLARQGKTIVMVTHDADLARRAQRSITIADGQIVDDCLNRTKGRSSRHTTIVYRERGI